MFHRGFLLLDPVRRSGWLSIWIVQLSIFVAFWTTERYALPTFSALYSVNSIIAKLMYGSLNRPFERFSLCILNPVVNCNYVHFF